MKNRGSDMKLSRVLVQLTGIAVIVSATACGRIGPGSIGSGNGSLGSGSLGSGGGVDIEGDSERQRQARIDAGVEDPDRETIWDLFENRDDPNVTLQVNKFIWRASLEVLNFLPIQAADPFSGLIVTGYGTPPGGGRAYRATIYITDPALDARSLNLSLQTQGGRAVDADTQRAVEDAILTRARQLRIAEGNL